MNDETNARLHATVTGRVQGVNFRFFVLEEAEKLGLRGWVRNKWNGSVEVTAEGGRESLEKLLAALREGPPMAWVGNVDFEWLPATGEYASFDVTKTV